MAEAADSPQRLAMLGSVPLFSALEKGQLRTLARTAKERTYKAGETIVKQGDKGIGFYMILDGQARVEKGGRQVAMLGSGQFFGEMALLDDQPRTADVMAHVPCRCLVLSSWEFWSGIGDDPKVLRALLKETVRRIRSGKAELSE